MQIIWSIKNVKSKSKIDDLQNVVTHVYWDCKIIDEENELSDFRYGVVAVELDKSKPFIAFEDLTDEIYLQWVFQSAMSKHDVEDELTKSINAKKQFLKEA